MAMLRFLIIVLIAAFPSSAAWAHSQSYGFVAMTLDGSSASGRLELAVRDLDLVYDLDTDRNGKITWGEFRNRESEIIASSLDRLSLGAAPTRCVLTGMPAMTDSRGGETYIVMPFAGRCPPSTGPVTIAYDLLFSINAQHRGIIAVTTPGGTRTFVATPDARQISVDPSGAGGIGESLSFIVHGAHHIWMGYDHILFLLTLLIGTFAGREASMRDKVYAAVKVVTAFTLSHSLTLGLAAFGIVNVPPALTESLVAVTISLAALNNIWPLLSRRLWLVALCFGLVHGLGFANVLAELGLPRENLLAALFAFNLGVELGQLAIVFAALPVIMLIASKSPFPRFALPAANLAIAGIGAMWFADRAFGFALLPF
jgi:HupE / UreJ protein